MAIPPAHAQFDSMMLPAVEKNYQPRAYQGKLEADDGQWIRQGARGLVGPPLDGIGERVYIAGELPNTPDNIMLWIQHPHQVEPRTIMPEMGVSEQDSRDIAAYL